MDGDVLKASPALPAVRESLSRDAACEESGEAQKVDGRQIRGRIAIETISPEIDSGKFPAKRIVGEHLRVEADIFSDGHDKLAAELVYRREDETAWSSTPMHHVDNDRWRGMFLLLENGSYIYTIVAWRDLFGTWREDVKKKRSAGQYVTLELQEGRHLIEKARHHTSGSVSIEDLLRSLSRLTSDDERLNVLLQDEVARLMDRIGPRANETRASRDLKVWVDRPAAAFSAWYELFPRSQSGDVRRHGTFEDVVARLDYVADLGFDVLYFPPIHPIGEVNRKGRNNSLTAAPDDPGSPYAIGSKLGGHDAIHPQLGSAGDFRRLVAAARERGLEIALDFAIQCAPDHPWIKEHPEWFDWRPDGTIKFAENPPKKYEDIVNVHFYRDAFPVLWHALRDVVLHWVGEGVRIFRVDNPHTKPFPFWEWLIGEVHDAHPDVIFLSEAFTRPKIMERLAKIGFTQSYTYFTWRNTKAELIEYLDKLTKTEMVEYYRPNFFTNTPDINPFFLQTSGRAGFRIRLLLAAMLSGNYGIYNGFELCEAAALPGREEYRDSEKYEIRAWDWDREGHIKDDVRLVNRLRRSHPALQQLKNLTFLNAWNDQILYFMKYSEDRRNIILCACNLDPHHGQGAHFEVPLWELGLGDEESVGVYDLSTGERFTWTGKVQHMWLDPETQPYRLWRLIPPEEESAPAGMRP